VKTGCAAHAYPRRVHYVADLPRTPSGKVQRYLIRKQLLDAAVTQAPQETA
jgi:acetyl-CoA synthetase